MAIRKYTQAEEVSLLATKNLVNATKEASVFSEPKEEVKEPVKEVDKDK